MRAALLLALAASGCGQSLVDFFVGGTGGGGNDFSVEIADLSQPPLSDLARVGDASLEDSGAPDLAQASPDLGISPNADLAPAACSAAQLAGGDDSILAPDQPHQDPGGTVAVEAWIYPTALGNADQALVAHWHPTSAGQRAYRLFLDATGHVVFEISAAASGVHTVVSSGTVASGAWTHVAGVLVPDVANATLRVFLNGTGTALNGFSALTLNGSNAGLVMGNLSDGSAPFAGYLSEVRVQAAVVYSADFTPPSTVSAGALTLALYHLDEVSGTVAADSAIGPNRPNDATLLNGAAFATPPSCR